MTRNSRFTYLPTYIPTYLQYSLSLSLSPGRSVILGFSGSGSGTTLSTLASCNQNNSIFYTNHIHTNPFHNLPKPTQFYPVLTKEQPYIGPTSFLKGIPFSTPGTKEYLSISREKEKITGREGKVRSGQAN
ncbi:hypothetical protein EYC80_005785 [Monilinia laxa]|uniref:Uncharacterized protein n=1 Tax=Monilinia laxa TaxID=61186 RepID=A0A5N6KEZ4_MONLA|nr:hypothetical protein EYC80_005785 [Monilinia laxa]